jgi:hypothetical protein
VEFKDVSAFILNPSTNEAFLIPLEGRLHALEHMASDALNRLVASMIVRRPMWPVEPFPEHRTRYLSTLDRCSSTVRAGSARHLAGSTPFSESRMSNLPRFARFLRATSTSRRACRRGRAISKASGWASALRRGGRDARVSGVERATKLPAAFTELVSLAGYALLVHNGLLGKVLRL